MEICSNDHDEVCYETAKCPACLAYENGKSEGYDTGHSDGYDEGKDDNE